MHSNEKLKKNGFIVFKNFLNDDFVRKMNLNFLPNDEINYKVFDSQIKYILENHLKKIFMWNCQASKYRVSEGKCPKTSNSTDAAGFHRDINLFESNEIMDIYSLVIYLDNATLQIIPESHKTYEIEKLKKPINIDFSCGDAIIFNSFSLHRGMFEKQQKSQSRKCIQIFEIISDKKNYDKSMSTMITIPGTNEGKLLLRMIQTYFKIPILNKFVNEKTIVSSIKKKKNYFYPNLYYISVEGTRERAFRDICKGNQYRILNRINDSKNNLRDRFFYIQIYYLASFLHILFKFLIFLYLLINHSYF